MAANELLRGRGSGQAIACWEHVKRVPAEREVVCSPRRLSNSQSRPSLFESRRTEGTGAARLPLYLVIVAGVVTALAYWKRPSLMLPLAAWWLHIALDVPTRSSDYYAVPLFCPLTLWGVDGVAWTEPWMLALNYLALAAAYLWLWRRRRSGFAAGGRVGPAK